MNKAKSKNKLRWIKDKCKSMLTIKPRTDDFTLEDWERIELKRKAQDMKTHYLHLRM
ncbi:MAG: hypothetical protein H6623_06885 [Bdellovibrionaceae bacterium]|nr:hypothetical protein [Pseudobdellovibrionaceae bacterium]